MKTSLDKNRERGLTLVELFVVMAVITLFSIFFVLQPDRNGKTRATRIQCVNNLKQTGLAFRVWQGDQSVVFPMQRFSTNGGTREFTSGPNEFRHFLVMSNELSTPLVLICPSDRTRIRATNFSFFGNSNISFFVGVDVTNDTNPQMILSGDRNITNGTLIKNGILALTANQSAGWTAELHNKVGNILLSDGSVQQLSATTLRSTIAGTGIFTNRLQMPILSP